MAAKRFEADGIPTRTGRHGGDQWGFVEARVRVTAAEFGLETAGGSTSHPQSGFGQQQGDYYPQQRVYGGGY